MPRTQRNLSFFTMTVLYFLFHNISHLSFVKSPQLPPILHPFLFSQKFDRNYAMLFLPLTSGILQTHWQEKTCTCTVSSYEKAGSFFIFFSKKLIASCSFSPALVACNIQPNLSFFFFFNLRKGITKVHNRTSSIKFDAINVKKS